MTKQLAENSAQSSSVETIADAVHKLKILFVNAYLIGTPENGAGSWVLVDTGLPKTYGRTLRVAAELFGANRAPSAIVLTHGHFDHAGSALELAEEWNVPIYAHHLEMPYLTGKSDYAPQDPTVGGALAQMSRVFPHSGYNFGERVKQLPENGEIPEMSGWQFIHTPGHTAGHISLFRETDRTLIAGDALATLNQDSWVSNVTEKQEFHRPPSPLTPDWTAARESVEKLAALEPRVVAAGHGKPFTDANTAEQLRQFSDTFAAPSHGRYVPVPATADERGIINVPPPVPDPKLRIAAGVGIAAAAGIAISALARKRND